jgi:hypothetical protein
MVFLPYFDGFLLMEDHIKVGQFVPDLHQDLAQVVGAGLGNVLLAGAIAPELIVPVITFFYIPVAC